jgi:hypothetical protein
VHFSLTPSFVVQGAEVDRGERGEGAAGAGAGIDEAGIAMYAKNLVSLADALVEVDREAYSAHAESIIRRAAHVLARGLGALRLEVAELALVPLARVLGQQRGDWLDAAQTLLRARTIMLTWLPPEHPRVRNVSELLVQAQERVEMASSLPSGPGARRGPAPVHAASFY